MRKCSFYRSLVFVLVFLEAVIGLAPSSASAMPSQSMSMVSIVSSRQAQVDKIMQVLSAPQAQLHLRLAGVKEADVRDALLKLDDAQLADVSSKADTVKAGGEVVGLVIGILLIVLLVLVILNISNRKIIVKEEK